MFRWRRKVGYAPVALLGGCGCGECKVGNVIAYGWKSKSFGLRSMVVEMARKNRNRVLLEAIDRSCRRECGRAWRVWCGDGRDGDVGLP